MPAARLIPEDILAFLEDVTKKRVFIEDRTLGGFEICTDMGSSFSFEIVADSPEEVVLAYFWHVRSVYAFEPKFLRRTHLRFALGWKRYRRDEADRKRKLLQLDAFAKTHNLRPPPPKEDAPDP